MAFIVPLSDVLLYGLEPAMEASSHDTAHQELTEVHGEGEGMPAFACGLNLVVTSVRCPSLLKSVHVSRDHAGICFSDLLHGYSFRTFEGRFNWNMPGDNSFAVTSDTSNRQLVCEHWGSSKCTATQYFWVNFPDLINTIILVMQKYFRLMLIHFHVQCLFWVLSALTAWQFSSLLFHRLPWTSLQNSNLLSLI